MTNVAAPRSHRKAFMMFNKAFRVCALAFSLPVGLMACDNEGTGGSGSTLSASSGGADPGSLSADPGAADRFDVGENKPHFEASSAPAPGSLSVRPDSPSGGSGGGGSCSLATACDEFTKALTSFVRRTCAQAGAGRDQCEKSLEGIYSEFDASCQLAISSGEATAAELCEAVDCISCYFEKVSLTSDTQDLDACSVAACQSVCSRTCASQNANGRDSSNI